jgi:hypothetical protein
MAFCQWDWCGESVLSGKESMKMEVGTVSVFRLLLDNQIDSVLGVILCDPQVKTIRVNWHQRPETLEVTTSSFQGGYVDFLPQNQQLLDPKGPPRTSMLDDFCFYWDRMVRVESQYQGPGLVSFLIQKIIIGHHSKLIDFVRAYNSYHQWTLTRRDSLALDITSVEQQWSDCQQAERRLIGFCEDLENILLILGIPLNDPDTSRTDRTWMDNTADFQFIYKRLKQQHIRAKELMSSMTGLASIAANRQVSIEQERSIEAARRSIRESKSAKALTFVGLIFIPLAYTASLLSMSDGFLPGSDQFWIYFGISIPLIIIVLLSFIMLDRGYDDEANWSLDHFQTSVNHSMKGFLNKFRSWTKKTT